MKWFITVPLLLVSIPAYCPPVSYTEVKHTCTDYTFQPTDQFEDCVYSLFLYGNELCIRYGVRTSVMISQAILEQGTDCHLEKGYRIFNMLPWGSYKRCEFIFDRYMQEWRCHQVFDHPEEAIRAYLELLKNHPHFYAAVFETSIPVQQVIAIGNSPYAEAEHYGKALMEIQPKVKRKLIEIINSKETFIYYKLQLL